MLHTFMTSGARRGVCVRRRRQSLWEEAGPTTTPHLRAANVSVDTLARVTLLLPPAAMRKLQASVTA